MLFFQKLNLEDSYYDRPIRRLVPGILIFPFFFFSLTAKSIFLFYIYFILFCVSFHMHSAFSLLHRDWLYMGSEAQDCICCLLWPTCVPPAQLAVSPAVVTTSTIVAWEGLNWLLVDKEAYSVPLTPSLSWAGTLGSSFLLSYVNLSKLSL